MKFDGGRFLAELYSEQPRLAQLLESMITAANRAADQVGASPVGYGQPPPPVNAINLKANGEMIHVTLSHAAVVSRAVRYFLEADTSPYFTQPHPIDMGASRTHVFTLPTFDDNNAPHNWYFQAFAQYPGGPPSKPTVLGGAQNPTAVKLQGTTRMTLLASTGSGTASPTGQQPGQGLGKQPRSLPKVIRIGRPQASSAAVTPPSIAAAAHMLATIASASQVTSITQSGTTTAINVAAGVFKLGPYTVHTNAGSVDPGAYGKYYIYHDDPLWQGGNVTYNATTDPTVVAQGFGRFFDGSLTTAAGGGGSGGGTGGGGGRPPFLQ